MYHPVALAMTMLNIIFKELLHEKLRGWYGQRIEESQKNTELHGQNIGGDNYSTVFRTVL